MPPLEVRLALVTTVGGPRGRVEPGAHLPAQRFKAVFVEHLHGFPVEIVAEAVRIVLHPGQQQFRRFIRGRARCLTRLDPAAKQVLDQHSKFATRIVDLIGFLMASGDERFIETGCPFRLALNNFVQIARNFLEALHERP